jgi:hypothetical protein
MKKFVLLVLAAASLFAQEKGATAPPPLYPDETIRVVEVKNANATDIRITLSRLFSGITESNGRLVVRGKAPVVDMIEDAVKKLDVPPPTPPEQRPMPNVELTVQLLYGAAMEEGKGTPIPADLEPTVKQLRSLFPYKSYKILDTELLRARSGREVSTNGSLPGGTALFNFGAVPSVNQETPPRSIRLSHLFLEVREPNGAQFTAAKISGDFDAKEGQRVVVGKANLVNSQDAIILVITPKVIE